MATPYKVQLSVEDTGAVKFQQPTTESAAKASDLLQKNHDNYHIFFRKDGFHNHITHGLLTLYGLGAPASVLQRHYDTNASYQRPPGKVEEQIIQDMSDPDNFKKYLGKEKYYHDFLIFFEKEMEKKGWQDVVNEYVFAGDARADDMLVRMYAGFLHPLIHLGFGVEFNQPAIVAEALAQAAVHDAWIGDLLLATEQASKAQGPTDKTLPDLLSDIRKDKKLSEAARWEDANKVRDGVLQRAPQEMIKHAAQWSVSSTTLEEKTAEMINASVYFTAGAQHPPKQVKFDFYYMHCVNCSVFFPTFNAQTWLSSKAKVRLLTWKGYLDLAMYASRRSPELLIEEIVGFVPKDLEAGSSSWTGVFRRLFDFDDDGHAIKLGRAVRNGQVVCQKFEDEEWCKIKDWQWEKIGNMVVDSVEDTGQNWVRSAGFEEAWEGFEDRPRSTHL
ncbi:hypothetical protein BP6252_00355 [Coleophoma cylindrospora]|uniref:HypA-like protein n=1 Tax=Coleophoma cylindrospora TaxID=1849047 RepID=A0A3D8SPS5_9HELO|nr:hypothetical protein BP6252_00355 [Coleophoma cylindrospora]